ncbi:zeta toxin [Paucimonas lemoignei]|nr:zeta toxin [Paucimonas lemoignei]
MTADELAIEIRAIEFAKKHRTEIARAIACKAKYPEEEVPISVFMAGSPGAGKTEVSKAFIALLQSYGSNALRIDPDDLRDHFPDYTGSNSALFQKAVSKIVERLVDLVLDQRQSFLLDGTLANLSVARRNIERSIKRGRQTQIVYVYQKPELAWRFVVAREVTEGRNIPCDEFVRQFFAAKSTVCSLKAEFGTLLQVDVIVKNNDGDTADIGIDLAVDEIDAMTLHNYDPEVLKKSLTEVNP